MTLRNAFENLATDSSAQGIRTDLGTDGGAPPIIAGTGVRGWLRAIYDKIVSGISVTGTVTVANPTAQGITDAQLRASSVPVSIASVPSHPVTGAFWQATQPVSLASQPLPTGASTESTLSALKGSIDALSAKVTAVNTGAVALDAATLSALESVTAAVTGSVAVSNFPAVSGLTNTELRATAVPVSDPNTLATKSAIDALSGKVAACDTTELATESSLAAVNAKLPELANGRVQVELPPDGVGLTISDLRSDPIHVAIDELTYFLSAILEKMPRIDSQDRVITNGAEVSAGVTISSGTVSTVSNQTNIGGRDASHLAYAMANSGAMHIYNNITVSN